MNKLKRFYGDTMVGIGIWFMKRGEKYATWIEFHHDNKSGDKS